MLQKFHITYQPTFSCGGKEFVIESYMKDDEIYACKSVKDDKFPESDER